MSELPEGVSPAQVPRPRPSASGIVVRRGRDGRWDVLLGLRSRGSRFLPGHLAFPGGGLDPADRPGEPGAFARCVARETREETGLEIAPERWLHAGERTTPPLYPLRFHTHFFVAAADPATDRIDDAPPSPEEIESLSWEPPRSVLEGWLRGELRLPAPTIPILKALAVEGSRGPEEIAHRIAEVNAVEQQTPRVEFAPDIWAAVVRTATLPPATHTNVWLPGGRSFVIIDPGSTEPGEQRRLLDVIDRRVAAGARPVAVLLTHHHGDHVGGAAALARSLTLPVWAHRQVLETHRFPADVATRAVADGERIDLDGLTLVALHTPGHARGHLAFVVEGRRQVISGDLVSGLSTILIDPDSGDMDDYLRSLERLRDSGCRQLFPGHGPPLPAVAVDRLLEHRRGRERAILERLAAGPVRLDRLTDAVYAGQGELPSALTRRQVLSHLVRLERRGQARRLDPAGDRWEAS